HVACRWYMILHRSPVARALLPTPTAAERVQAEVVLGSARAEDVVRAVREAEDYAACGALPSRDRPELHRDVHVSERPGRRHDDVELILGRALHEHLLAARRAGHVLDGPLTVHRRPSLDALGLEVEAIHGNVFRQLDLRWRGTRSRMPAQAESSGRRQSGLDQTTS